jgi:putative oxidoreductase
MDKKKRLRTIFLTNGMDNGTIMIRFIVGLIFMSEGIQKYLFPGTLGTGRFLQIGFSHPAFWAYFTGSFEIICGLLVLLGMFTRVATIPLFLIMITAFATTKWPILIDKGLWAMAHEYRTDFAMTILLVYLVIYGGGNWSIDSKLWKT